MKLDEFIQQTITDIINGTKAATEELKGTVEIAPLVEGEYKNIPSQCEHIPMGNKEKPVILIDFKVSLIVEETSTVDGGISSSLIKVLSSSINGKSVTASSSLNEVRFSVPLIWTGK